ncbi:MAG: extracellular solute-binding protein [Lentisphaeria bacterium]|nr:extracellular solute-binding protein [Lentisphaeria bacterium]NQZ71111.1 extracellular solute-binding protein [Lentisphaeria bacterium]
MFKGLLFLSIIMATFAADTELQFWHIQNKSPTKEVIAASIKRFEKDNPGIKIKETAYKNDAFKLKLKTAMHAGKAPDVFHSWGGGVLKEQYKAGFVLPLDKLYTDAYKKRFLKAAESFIYIDKKPLLVPVDLSAVFFFYNKALFAKHGLKPPKTKAELNTLCEKLKSKKLQAIALGNKDKWPGAFFYGYELLCNASEKDLADAGQLKKGVFLSPAFIAAGNGLLEYARKKQFSIGFQGMDYDAAQRLLFKGRAGMMLMGTWLIASAQSKAADFYKNIGCFPYPGAKGLIGGVNCAFAVNAKTKHAKEALKFLSYLSDEKFAAAWARTGRIPATQGAKDGDFAAITKEAFGHIEKAAYIQLYLDQYFPAAIGEIHKDTSQALSSGKTTAKDVSAALEKAAEKLR